MVKVLTLFFLKDVNKRHTYEKHITSFLTMWHKTSLLFCGLHKVLTGVSLAH